MFFLFVLSSLIISAGIHLSFVFASFHPVLIATPLSVFLFLFGYGSYKETIQNLQHDIDTLKSEHKKSITAHNEKFNTLMSEHRTLSDNYKKTKEHESDLQKLVENYKSDLQELIDTPYAEQYHKAVSYFSEIKADNPFFSGNLYQRYCDAFRSHRLDRSLSRYLSRPSHVEIMAKIPSFSSDKLYSTSITSCECKDFQLHARPCKHMVSLALFVNATYNMNRDANNLLVKVTREREQTQKLTDEAKAEKELAIKAYHSAGEERSQTEILLKAISEKEQTYPWLADIISNYRTAKLNVTIRDPITKRDMTSLLQKQEKKIALLENQLAVWKYQFPILEEIGDMSPDNLSSVLAAPGNAGFVYNWLSDDEYHVLTSEEKQEKWLDHYFHGKSRDAWSAGIKYERYIGYLCETKGYKVKYFGATMKLQDMGRDLIVSKGKKVYLIQCKRYSSSKEIHENSIFQLFGSLYHYRVENPDKVTVGVFVTSSKLTDLARECAKALNITLYEDVKFDRYPAVKCNISKTGERIYHLPYDQQYDTVSIIPAKGECYTTYVSEAIEQGFRHAYRHILAG